MNIPCPRYSGTDRHGSHSGADTLEQQHKLTIITDGEQRNYLGIPVMLFHTYVLFINQRGRRTCVYAYSQQRFLTPIYVATHDVVTKPFQMIRQEFLWCQSSDRALFRFSVCPCHASHTLMNLKLYIT